MIRKTLLAALLAASFAGTAVTAYAATTYILVAPPAPRTEAVPAARRGHQWVAGHWEWKNKKHQWMAGNWIRERRGYVYTQPAWAENNGRWAMQRGSWRRGDRDGDGVPNGRDRAPNNPNRS